MLFFLIYIEPYLCKIAKTKNKIIYLHVRKFKADKNRSCNPDPIYANCENNKKQGFALQLVGKSLQKFLHQFFIAMYSTQFLPLLLRHFKLSRPICCLPFEFDSKSGKVAVIKSPNRRGLSHLQFTLTILYALVLLAHFCFGKVTMLKRLQGFPFLVCFAVLISSGWNVVLDIGPMQLINSIVTFEEGVSKGMHNNFVGPLGCYTLLKIMLIYCKVNAFTHK